MNAKFRKMMSFDRLLLLSVLIIQLIIVIRYIAPESDTEPTDTGPDEIVSNSQARPKNSRGDHLQMRLPLPPGYSESESKTHQQHDMDDVFTAMHREMNDMMRRAQMDFDRIDHLMSMNDGWNRLMKSPSMDIKEKTDRYIITLSIPGGTATNVAITLDGRLLSIRSQYEMQDTMGKSSQRFEKRVLLPAAVDSGNVTRTLSDDGILQISIMKKKKTESNNIDDNEKKEL